MCVDKYLASVLDEEDEDDDYGQVAKDANGSTDDVDDLECVTLMTLSARSRTLKILGITWSSADEDVVTLLKTSFGKDEFSIIAVAAGAESYLNQPQQPNFYTHQLDSFNPLAQHVLCCSACCANELKLYCTTVCDSHGTAVTDVDWTSDFCCETVVLL